MRAATSRPRRARLASALLLVPALLLTLPASGACGVGVGPQVPAAADVRLREAMVAMARTSSVVGREGQAAAQVRALLGNGAGPDGAGNTEELHPVTDALGNVVVTLGSGSPRRLLAVPLDEPGYVVSRIDDAGMLRITPAGQGYRGALAHQALEGNEVTVVTAGGPVPGAVGVPSAHLTSYARTPVRAWEPFAWQDAYVEVGAGSAGEARALGIRPMDTLTLIKRPTVLRGGLVAAPSMQEKAAAVALAEAAYRIAAAPPAGSVVLAWTTLGLLNGRGLESVVRRLGPFDEAWVFSRNFGWSVQERAWVPEPEPALGSGVLSAEPLDGATEAPHLPMFRGDLAGALGDEVPVHYLGLPTRYQDTPIETVAAADAAALADRFVAASGADAAGPSAAPTPPALRPGPLAADPAPADRPFGELAGMLGSLVARYGVSGAETPVAERIRELLPEGVEAHADPAGNLFVTLGPGGRAGAAAEDGAEPGSGEAPGQGVGHLVFVAHMDETGYRVREISDDGTLVLDPVGGNLHWVWEAQAALVHTAAGDVPGVFEPRLGHLNARSRASEEPLTASVGAATAAEVAALGVRIGDTVTMPKAIRRVGWYRALARAFDDRAGSTALIEALRRIDPARLRQRVTFAWSVGEEIGLLGARQLAARFDDADIVYPIDTFVSSDAPLESRRTAYAPLGAGLVIRVVESINFAPAAQVARVQALAAAHEIPVQLGMTSGGTDGQPWVARGIPSVPLSWPGRYSHSPIEVLDLRDLDGLVRMIVVLAEQPPQSE